MATNLTITTSLAIQAGNPECQDRAEIIRDTDRTVLVLADGAGGISGGAKAAECFLALVRQSVEKCQTPEDCLQLLRRFDQELARRSGCGETTGVIVVVAPSRMFGASLGDSAAWFFTSGGNGELTYGQPRKPLLGSGEAPLPRVFDWPIEAGTLVVASDGLWNYTTIDAIASRVQTRDSDDLALRLAELSRMKSGAFPDDVAVITCQMAL